MEGRIPYYDFVAILVPGTLLASLLLFVLFQAQGIKMDALIEHPPGAIMQFSLLGIFAAGSYALGEILFILGEFLERPLRHIRMFGSDADIFRLTFRHNEIPSSLILFLKKRLVAKIPLPQGTRTTTSRKIPKDLQKIYLGHLKIFAREIETNRLDLFQGLAHFTRSLSALMLLIATATPLVLINPELNKIVWEDYCVLRPDCSFAAYLPGIFLLIIACLGSTRVPKKPASRKMRLPLPVATNRASRIMRRSVFFCFRFWRRRRENFIALSIGGALISYLYCCFFCVSFIAGKVLGFGIFIVTLILIKNFIQTFGRYYLELFSCAHLKLR